MVVRLKIYEDDNGLLIGDLSTHSNEGDYEGYRMLLRLLMVALVAGEGILGTVYTRSNAPVEAGHEPFGEPWGRTIYGNELAGFVAFHANPASHAGVCVNGCSPCCRAVAAC
jgi:hypothetical protein